MAANTDYNSSPSLTRLSPSVTPNTPPTTPKPSLLTGIGRLAGKIGNIRNSIKAQPNSAREVSESPPPSPSTPRTRGLSRTSTFLTNAEAYLKNRFTPEKGDKLTHEFYAGTRDTLESMITNFKDSKKEIEDKIKTTTDDKQKESLNAQLNDFDNEIINLDKQLKELKDKHSPTLPRRMVLEDKRNELHKQIGELENQLEELKEKTGDTSEEVKATKQIIDTYHDEVSSLEAKIKNETAKATKGKILKHKFHDDGQTKIATEKAVRLDTVDMQRESLESAIQDLGQEKAQLDKDIADIEQSLKTMESGIRLGGQRSPETKIPKLEYDALSAQYATKMKKLTLVNAEIEKKTIQLAKHNDIAGNAKWGGTQASKEVYRLDDPKHDRLAILANLRVQTVEAKVDIPSTNPTESIKKGDIISTTVRSACPTDFTHGETNLAEMKDYKLLNKLKNGEELSIKETAYIQQKYKLVTNKDYELLDKLSNNQKITKEETEYLQKKYNLLSNGKWDEEKIRRCYNKACEDINNSFYTLKNETEKTRANFNLLDTVLYQLKKNELIDQHDISTLAMYYDITTDNKIDIKKIEKLHAEIGEPLARLDTPFREVDTRIKQSYGQDVVGNNKEIDLNKLDECIAERTEYLQSLFLQDLRAHCEAEPIEGDTLMLSRASLVNMKKGPDARANGPTLWEKNQGYDAKALYDDMDGREIIYGKFDAPFINLKGQICIPSSYRKDGKEGTGKLETAFLNSSVQGSKSNTGPQKAINDDFLKKLEGYISKGKITQKEFDDLKTMLNDPNSVKFEVVEHATHLMKKCGFRVSINCYGGKDRTGYLLALITHRALSRLTTDVALRAKFGEALLSDESLAVRVILDCVGIRAIKITEHRIKLLGKNFKGIGKIAKIFVRSGQAKVATPLITEKSEIGTGQVYRKSRSISQIQRSQ